MQLQVETSFPMPTDEPETYASPVKIDLIELVEAYPGSDEPQVLTIGTVFATQLSIGIGVDHKVSAFDIFDSTSWRPFYELLFDEDGEPLDELEIVDAMDPVVVIYQTFFSKCLDDYRAIALYLITQYFTHKTFFVIVDPSPFSKKDLAACGFEQLGNSPAVYRHNIYLSPIRKRGNDYLSTTVPATPNDQRWVKKQVWAHWKGSI